jgi:DNA-binding transcriptional LysR family regulator
LLAHRTKRSRLLRFTRRHGAPAHPSDLVRHRCLSNIVAGVAEGWSVKVRRKRKQVQVQVASQLLADNGEILRMACLRGVGVGNFYRFHVQEDLKIGRLVEVLGAYQFDSNFLYAIMPHREMIRPQVQLLIEFVRNVVTNKPSAT